jgi:hypothetical protein
MGKRSAMEMTQPAARRSLAIQVLTALIVLITAGVLVAAFFVHQLFFVGILLALTCILAYLWTPVRYELSDDRLIVCFHVGTRRFTPVVRCSRVEHSLAWSLRLFGNGGAFAGIGYFWNRLLGFFQAYVTSARHDDLVLVETDTRKVVISPEDPGAFVAAWRMSRNTRDDAPAGADHTTKP